MEEKPSLLSPEQAERWLLAAMPLAGFAIAFVYECGFANYFNVPVEYISISLATILVSTFFVFGTAYWGYVLARPVTSLKAKDDSLNRRLRVSGVVAFVLAAQWVAFRGFNSVMFLPVVTYIIYLLYTCALPLLFNRNHAYWERIKISDEQGEKEWIVPRRYRPLTMIVAWFMVLIVIAYSSGRGIANQDRTYKVIHDRDVVVVRIYGDNLICAPLDRKNKLVIPAFRVIKSTDKIVLDLEDVGPLQPAPKEMDPNVRRALTSNMNFSAL